MSFTNKSDVVRQLEEVGAEKETTLRKEIMERIGMYNGQPISITVPMRFDRGRLVAIVTELKNAGWDASYADHLDPKEPETVMLVIK